MINYFSAVITALLAVIYAVSRVGFGLPGLNQRTAKLSDVIGPVMTVKRGEENLIPVNSGFQRHLFPGYFTLNLIGGGTHSHWFSRFRYIKCDCRTIG